MGTPTQVCVWSCPNFSAPAGMPFRCVKSKREMEGKGPGGSNQTPTKKQDALVEEARKVAEEAEKKKKANEDAERRRKAMEDKRAVEEQEKKRKAEQDRKNAEDAKRRRNEEAER
ncbi:hypothetical protein Tco_1031319 [Tanacetum coccineum]|uniref:Uncharacterized protein n=1 Tax=Tanacetum coccineum TaxID=301880 RepID=A0ABQ5G9S1_9ASTR